MRKSLMSPVAVLSNFAEDSDFFAGKSTFFTAGRNGLEVWQLIDKRSKTCPNFLSDKSYFVHILVKENSSILMTFEKVY